MDTFWNSLFSTETRTPNYSACSTRLSPLTVRTLGKIIPNWWLCFLNFQCNYHLLFFFQMIGPEGRIDVKLSKQPLKFKQIWALPFWCKIIKITPQVQPFKICLNGRDACSALKNFSFWLVSHTHFCASTKAPFG